MEETGSPLPGSSCLGDDGVALVASSQILPRSSMFPASGRWLRVARIAYENYLLRRVRQKRTEPIYRKQILQWIDAEIPDSV